MPFAAAVSNFALKLPRGGFACFHQYGTNPQRACASSMPGSAASRLSMMTRIVGATL